MNVFMKKPGKHSPVYLRYSDVRTLQLNEELGHAEI